MLESMENGGAVACREVELARCTLCDVVCNDTIDLLTERLDRDLSLSAVAIFKRG